MEGRFDRRTYTPGLLIKDLAFLASNAPGIARAMRGGRVSRSFRERIMIVVTAVNGCPYCAWFHARLAASSGIGREEVANMLRLQFRADTPEDEIEGLLYAQHYAESDRRPDQGMTKRLFDHYGEEATEEMVLTIRLISFGNLLGNTLDAFLNRLRGEGARDGNALFESLLFMLASPFMLPALLASKERGPGL